MSGPDLLWTCSLRDRVPFFLTATFICEMRKQPLGMSVLRHVLEWFEKGSFSERKRQFSTKCPRWATGKGLLAQEKPWMAHNHIPKSETSAGFMSYKRFWSQRKLSILWLCPYHSTFSSGKTWNRNKMHKWVWKGWSCPFFSCRACSWVS